MKISVITVSLNSEKTIEKTILSVIRQSYGNVEYIIVDGGSTDLTMDIVSKYKDNIQVVISEPDRGLYDAMNKGISRATGDVIGILNSDDWYENDILEKAAAAFDNTDVDVVYTDFNLVSPDGTVEKALVGKMDEIWHWNPIGQCTTFVKKVKYTEVGVYDLKYRYAADYDHLFRLFISGCGFYHIKEVLGNFRLGGLSSQKLAETINESRLIQFKYFCYCPNKDEEMCSILQRYRTMMFQAYVNSQCSSDVREIAEEEFSLCDDCVVVFGAGQYGREAVELLNKANYNVSIVDNDANKWGTKISNVEIRSPEVCKHGKFCIVVAIKDSDDVMKQIKSWRNNSVTIVGYESLKRRLEKLVAENNKTVIEDSWKMVGGTFGGCKKSFCDNPNL